VDNFVVAVGGMDAPDSNRCGKVLTWPHTSDYSVFFLCALCRCDMSDMGIWPALVESILKGVDCRGANHVCRQPVPFVHNTGARIFVLLLSCSSFKKCGRNFDQWVCSRKRKLSYKSLIWTAKTGVEIRSI